MSKTYCVLPFTQISTSRGGDYLPCSSSVCPSGFNVGDTDIKTVWESDYYKDLRHALLNDIQHPNCKACWEAEELGLTSKRQRQNNYYEHRLQPLLMPTNIDIKTGNACNLKCITCNQLSSSQIDKEVNTWIDKGVKIPIWLETVGKQHKVFNPYNIGQIPKNIDEALKTATVLQMHGGEPFAATLTTQLLNHCIKKEYFDLSISIITNLTSLTPKILYKLNHFPKSDIVISYDHVDADKFKFIRYPAEYSYFTENLNHLNYTTFNWGISFTVSIFNVMDLEQIILEFEKLSYAQKFKGISINFVAEPATFCIGYLEPDQKQYVVTLIDKVIKKCPNLQKQKDFVSMLNELHSLIDFNPTDFDEVVKERTRVLNLYDETRGTNWRKLFPYIKE